MTAGASALLLVVGGGAIGVATLVLGDDKKAQVVSEANQAGQAGAGGPALPPPAAESPVDPPVGPPVVRGQALPPVARDARPADRTGPRLPAGQHRPQTSPVDRAPAVTSRTTTAAAAPPAAPVTTTRTEVETREIPYETRVVRDPTLPRGTRRVETPGVPGVETLRYLVTVTDGRPGERQLIDATVTKPPQAEVVAFGSRPRRGSGGECGHSLRLCVPLGRQAVCPEEEDATIAGTDVALLDHLELAC